MLICEGNGQKSLHQQLEEALLNLCCNTESPTTFSDHHSLDISTAKQNYTIFGDGAPPPSPMGVDTPLLLAAIGGLSNVRLKAWMVREQLFLKLHCNALPLHYLPPLLLLEDDVLPLLPSVLNKFLETLVDLS